MPSPPPTKPIPLLHNGDYWMITTTDPILSTVKILTLICYAKNDKDGAGSFENFRDLEEATQQAILTQIQRRFKGVTILR